MQTVQTGKSELQEKYYFLISVVKNRYPILETVWGNAYAKFGDTWLQEFIANIEHIYGKINFIENDSLNEAIDGYAEFVNDSLRSQVFYEKNGRYKASSYLECVSDFYHNADHMNRCYLPGMYISHYLWPQHYNMLASFRNNILPRVSTAESFFEVGVGCGIYSKVTLETLPQARGTGFDISQHSLDFTHNMLKQFGIGDRYSIQNRDISLGFSEKCDFLICQEVLEHLENPAEFCKWLANMIKPGGFAYITAAVNAAHSDHIYHFKNPLQLEEMLWEAGFQIQSGQEEFAYGYKPRHLTPSLAGFFCEKRK